MNYFRGKLNQAGMKLEGKASGDGSILSRLQANKGIPNHLSPIIYRHSNQHRNKSQIVRFSISVSSFY